MATWLIKTEPSDYSYDDLAGDKRTEWDGVNNPTAQMHMRAIAKGDECLVYHTGAERRITGLARVARGAYPDPSKPGQTKAGHTKYVLFDLTPIRAATKTCTLADVKSDDTSGC